MLSLKSRPSGRRVSDKESLPLEGRTPDARDSIAVLAFSDMSPAGDQDWFCEGLAEEIINALTQVESLRVAARSSSFSFKDRSPNISEVGAKLHVANVLEGSVRRAGDRVRITVQLVGVGDGFQLWSQQYDRKMEDIFDIQEAIARSIVERLRLTLFTGEDRRLVKVATQNMEAYELYLKGRALLSRRGLGTIQGRIPQQCCAA